MKTSTTSAMSGGHHDFGRGCHLMGGMSSHHATGLTARPTAPATAALVRCPALSAGPLPRGPAASPWPYRPHQEPADSDVRNGGSPALPADCRRPLKMPLCGRTLPWHTDSKR
jgi:hypothetical protein